MSDIWTIQVAGRTYGPYPLDHMKAFIAEGRIVPKSLVAYGEDTQFHSADEDIVLRGLFASNPEPAAAPHFEDEPGVTGDVTAEPVRAEGEPSHIIIMTDIKSRSNADVEEAIYSLGSAFPVMPHVWLLTSTESANNIRNMLKHRLGQIDSLLVINTTHDKVAWSNIGMDIESRIRRMWASAQRKAS